MPDREKVIKGLKWCMNEEHDCYREKGCPYENEGDDIGCKYALHRDALALLEAQEPVEPKKNYVELAGLRTWDWACPECNCILTYRANYCSCCGRAVKWDE